jgi:hypothetical protein
MISKIVFAACLPTIFLLTTIEADLRGQEGSSEIGACHEVSVNHLHHLQVLLRPQTVDVLERERFGGLLSDAARAELDLTNEQVELLRRLERRLAAIDRHRIELLWIALRDEVEERRTGAIKEISDERAALSRDIDDVLLPAQRNRLAQLEARKAILECGVEQALFADLPVRLSLDESSREMIRAKLGELRTHIHKQRLEQQDQLVKEVARVLSSKQRASLAATVGDIPRFLAPSLELLVWQVRQTPEEAPPRESSIAELLESPE